MNAAATEAISPDPRPARRSLLGRLRLSRPVDESISHSNTTRSIAVLLALVQLPHLPHLPLWVSAIGIAFVALRFHAGEKPAGHWSSRLLHPLPITLIAALAGVLLRVDYGYFLGRDPSVAFLFVLVAAKYAEMRNRSDVTMLLCLSMFLLLTEYFYSQSIVTAVITLPAVVALGLALATVRNPETSRDWRGTSALVARLLLQGLPLAALLFILFPRLPGPLWSLPEDAMATTGLSDSMDPGSIGRLSQSDAVAFRVEFDAQVPPLDALYWRGPVLSDFDGRRWKTSPSVVPARIARSTGEVIDYTVMLQPHRQTWLFALEQAASLPRASDQSASGIPAIGTFRSDGTLTSDRPVSQILRYRQQSILAGSVAQSSPPGAELLSLPDRNPRTAAFARALRKNSGSDAAFALNVLRHFTTEPFRYTLEPQLLGDRPVDEFLFTTREGFCEHYASAFVVLMRAAGIPARVVTGYQGGEMNGDYMIVRQADAHAWSEAWIDGRWQRFDPTAAVSPDRVERGLAAALPDELQLPRLARREAGDWLRDWHLRVDAMNHAWQRWVVDFDNDSQDKLWQKVGIDAPELWQLTVAMLLVAAVWVLLLLRPLRLRPQAANAEERAWRQLIVWLEKQGIERGKAETPAELLSRAESLLPREAERLREAQRLFEALRFTKADEVSSTRHWQTWRRLRRSLGC